MNLVVCSILLIIDAGAGSGGGYAAKADVEGVVLGYGPTKLMVDFSKDVKRFNIMDKTKDYARVLVDKQDCAEVKK